MTLVLFDADSDLECDEGHYEKRSVRNSMTTIHVETKKAEGADSFTFKVDDVELFSGGAKTQRMHELLKKVLGSEIESCSDYHSKVDGGFQGFLASVYRAYCEHRPLVISPDIVWLTITQGVAHHMALHAERLRHRLVKHEGKISLNFSFEGWVLGSPENPWEEAFRSWTDKIREHVGEKLHGDLVCDFSTTGTVERAASEVIMLDIFQHYFRYLAIGICGIPEITLLGNVSDWERLASKVKGLRVFDMDWWLDHLQPLCDEFVNARKGCPNVGHWQNICKLKSEYGGDVINGWIAKFFPYLRADIGGPCERKNPVFESGEGFSTLSAPGGISKAPFTFSDVTTGTVVSMEALGGTIGYTLDSETMAVEAKAFWAVRRAPLQDWLVQRIAGEHHVVPNPPEKINLSIGQTQQESPLSVWLQDEMYRFYYEFESASMFKKEGGGFRLQIHELGSLTGVDYGEKTAKYPRGPKPENCSWYHFGAFDSEVLACNLSSNCWENERKLFDRENRLGRRFCPICVIANDRPNRDEDPVVAVSFFELIERLFESNGEPYWKSSDFKPYETAGFYLRSSELKNERMD